MGTKYPKGQSPVYPPRDWTCVKCGKYHSKPHFAFPGQIDYSKKPTETRRVKFNRELKGSCDYNDIDLSQTVSPTKQGKTGPPTHILCGKSTSIIFASPLFCPHCGWEEEFIYIVKSKGMGGSWKPTMKSRWRPIAHKYCDITKCGGKVAYTNDIKYICEEHYYQFKEWGMLE